MTTVQPTYEPALTFDFRKSLEENRLKGIWKMMVDYRLPYIGATAALAVSALAKTLTYVLLRFFVDDVLTQGKFIGANLTQTFIWIALGFVGLALFEGGFAFLSGRLAAFTAEGITRRLRDFLFDHIQLEFLVSCDNSNRRFDRARDLRCGCIAPLLQRTRYRHGTYHPAVRDQLYRDFEPERKTGIDLSSGNTVHSVGVAVVLQESDQSI